MSLSSLSQQIDLDWFNILRFFPVGFPLVFSLLGQPPFQPRKKIPWEVPICQALLSMLDGQGGAAAPLPNSEE